MVFDIVSLLIGFGFGFGVCLYLVYILMERKGLIDDFVGEYGNEKQKEKFKEIEH
jgi:hypothetical protein